MSVTADLNDYSSRVNITGVTIASIPIDIVAQTIGNITIDIAAVSAGAIAISINVADIVGNLPIDIVAQTIGNISIDIAAQTVGNIGIDIAANSFGNLPIDIVAQTVGNIGISLNANTAGNITVDIAAQTMVGNLSIDIAANSFGNLPIDIVAQTIGNIGINLAANTLGNLTIDIAAQTLGNIAIDVAAQTVDLNIKTSGGANIIIDKLTVGAYTERRSTLSNDNNVTTPTLPPNYRTDITFYGKFFPRGARGNLAVLYVYCKRTAAGTLTLSYAPHPGMGAIGSVVITPDAAWDWKLVFIGKMWNYDSMFIWVSACSADVSYGYDTATPYDSHHSADSGVTWFGDSQRLFIRAMIQGETVGDIPVSGTLNTIEIPSLSSGRQYKFIDAIPATDEKYDTVQEGAGEVLYVIFIALREDARTSLRPRIECDGVQVMPIDTDMHDWQTMFITATTPGITVGVWNTTDHYYTLVVTIPYPFKRSLRVGFYNEAAAAREGYVGYSYKKIS